MRARLSVGRLTLLALLNASVWLLVMPCHASDDTKHVLVLLSYHQERSWTDNVMRGMRSVLDNAGMDFDIHVECMDTKRHPPESSFAYLEDLYRHKYAQIDFDVILLSDNNALTFVLPRRDALFPNVPVVFCGINNFSREMVRGQVDITGITEQIDVRGTVALALRIMPKIAKFVVINDRTPTGQANLKRFEDAAADLPTATIPFELWDDISAAELQERLAQLPAHSAVLLLTFHRDSNGQWFSIPEYWKLVRDSCRAPVFSFWDNDLGHGSLGGVMVHGEEQGKRCAEYAVRILRGEPAASLPVLLESPNVPVLDYRLLRRFGIPEARIPPEAITLFGPESLLHRYRHEIAALVILLSLLVILVIGLSASILRRRKTEHALIKSEALLEATQELAEVGGWEWDIEKSTMFWTEEMYRIHGLDTGSIMPGSSEHIGLSLECYDAEDRPAALNAFERCAREGRGYDLEFHFTRRDGQKLWIRTTARPVMSDSRPTKVIGTMMNITKQKQAVDALRESEERLRQVTENIQEVFWVGSHDWERVHYISPAYEKVWGLSCQSLYERPRSWLDAVVEEERERVIAAIAERIEPSTEITFPEFRIRQPDGSVRWILARAYPIQNERGQVYRVAGIAEDITERRRSEEERERLQAQLTQAHKMEAVGTLAGGIAHDFNNLLMGIMNYVELCRDGLDRDHQVRVWLDEIASDAQRSAELTRQLLAFARKQAIAPRALDLNDTVTSTLKMLRRLIGEDIDLNWQPGADVWLLEMDPSQLDQLLANLCVNARDAVGVGGVGRVTIETGNTTFDDAGCADHAEAVPGEYVMLAVSDNGKGMDPHTLERIFEPFFTTKEVGEGTGLGLATVYGIVRQNHGFISVASEPGQGSVFRIYLPRFAGDTAAHTDTATPPELVGGNETILLVEDEKSILVTAGIFLEHLGYTVLAAEAPEAALRLVAKHAGDVHLLITDVVMPGMSGRDLSERLARDFPKLKLLYMSGYTANVIAQHGILEEGVHFLSKPFTRQELVMKVRQILDS